MSEIEKFDLAKSLLNEFFNVISIKCPHFVGDRACVTCEKIDNCTAIRVVHGNYKDVKLLVAGNSAMLSIKFFFKSDIEQFIMEKLFHSLEENQEIPVIKPEDGFNLTFYTKHGQAIPKYQQSATITKVLDLLSEDPWTETKMLINNWINDILEKLNLQIKAEIKKVTLKMTPKIERSKIFEPKYKTQTKDAPPIEQKKVIYKPKTTVSIPNSNKPIIKTENTSDVFEKSIKKAEIPKQPFFITAKERENETASWPPYIKRKLPGEKEKSTMVIPSVTKSTKRIGTKELGVTKSGVSNGDKFELRIFEKKRAKVTPLPPMPKNDPSKILTYLEKLVKSDYEVRKIADSFDAGRDKIKKMMFYTDFLFEMGKIANILRRSDPGFALNEHTRKDLLKKISRWKSSIKEKKTI